MSLISQKQIQWSILYANIQLDEDVHTPRLVYTLSIDSFHVAYIHVRYIDASGSIGEQRNARDRVKWEKM